MAIEAQVYPDNYNLMAGSQDWVDNGCGFNEFCFDFQDQPQLQNVQLCNENFCFDDNSVLLPKNNDNDNEWLTFSQSIAIQVEKQRQEIDRFISIQNERLRFGLLHQRKCQVALLVKKYESKIQILLRQKDEEISRATNRAIELEELLRRIEIENHTWQRVGREKEAMVISLNHTLQQVEERLTNMDDSCSQIIGKIEKETGEQDERAICRSCNSRNSCLVFLPCRHLCSCKHCETLLDSCPVCSTVKQAVIEALI